MPNNHSIPLLHLLFLGLLAVFAVKIFCLSTETDVISYATRENEFIIQTFGEKIANEIQKTGHACYTSVFIDTGIVSNLRDFLLPPIQYPIEPIANLRHYVDEQLHVLNWALEGFIVRLAAFTTVLKFGWPVILAILICALLERKKHKQRFRFTSPFLNRLRQNGFHFFSQALILALFFPSPILPIIWIILLCFCTLALALFLASFQKYF